MKEKFSNLVLWSLKLSIVFLTILSVKAQSTTNLNDSTVDKSSVRIGVRYVSDYLYMGRSDSMKVPYLTPSIGYFHKSGFFINSSLSYLTGIEGGRVDLYTLSGGFDYYGKKHMLGISATQYFFSDLSYAVQSGMKTYLRGTAGYKFSSFIVYADVSLGFSEETDVLAGLEVERRIYLIKKKFWLTPSVSINAGSQHYYNVYYSERSTHSISGTHHGSGGLSHSTATIQDVQVLESDKFKVLDYEAALQIVYQYKKVRFYTTGTVAFPVNPSLIVDNQITYQEKLNTNFFWVIGIRLTIN